MSSIMAASHPSPVKDGRRILGEKPANACLSPAHHRHASVSPLKRPFLEAPSSPKKLLRSPLFAGQKRSIDQVDTNEPPSSTQPSAQAPSRPDASQNVQDDNLPQQDSQIQQQSHATESETTLLDSDKQQHHHHHEPQPTQQQPQPQQEDTHFVSPPPATTTTHPIPNDPETRKRFIKEKATLLRTRLQTAMRNIHDPQLDRRLSDLEAHSRKYPRLSLPQEQRSTIQSTPTQSSSSSNPCLTTPRVHTAPQLPPSSALHASGLSSPPLSAGTTTTPAAPHVEDQDLEGDEKEEGEEENDPMKTPTQKSHRRMDMYTQTQTSPMQLSSPPATVSRRRITTAITEEFLRADDEQEDVMREVGEAGEDMEQSHPEERQRRLSQKGDAVDGLLKLMNTGDQSEGLEVWSG
ncbi:hypothetical protein BO94DRAFT_625107 [Aspergillus sclerotioniger CBS 115572]|uniref:Uncharacterized protein n=1 Tax=Aspergillus sclerotioniger CBS 115572 TaxID=1450535 RepID=A0A317WEY4_9EURO|nr:hypothetical protein BO94DRAFT_625107 [Aspergillus sclerotioniger CBS 115572]PWY84575.1 hypothetical protein BO94DRAFT_625107 [Aspergillus sclerotioniger CBS 115572]